MYRVWVDSSRRLCRAPWTVQTTARLRALLREGNVEGVKLCWGIEVIIPWGNIGNDVVINRILNFTLIRHKRNFISIMRLGYTMMFGKGNF